MSLASDNHRVRVLDARAAADAVAAGAKGQTERSALITVVEALRHEIRAFAIQQERP